MQMDHDELAAKVAIANWHQRERTQWETFQTVGSLGMANLTRFLNYWMLARGNPLRHRESLLTFLNDHAIPALKEIDPTVKPTRQTYAVVEHLSQRATSVGNGKRPTSLLSKLALVICPEVFIPYDARARAALQGVREHAYCDYMEAVLSEKCAFDRALRDKNLTAARLDPDGMSQSLFEMRALDKRLMLRGGFNPATIEREIAVFKTNW
jgi:hypothetical protein